MESEGHKALQHCLKMRWTGEWQVADVHQHLLATVRKGLIPDDVAEQIYKCCVGITKDGYFQPPAFLLDEKLGAGNWDYEDDDNISVEEEVFESDTVI